MIWTAESIADVLRATAYAIGTSADGEERRHKTARDTLESVAIAFGLEAVQPLPRKQGQEPELRDLSWADAER